MESRWRNIKQVRIFAVVLEVVGNLSCLWILWVSSTIWFTRHVSSRMLSTRTCIHVAHCWAHTRYTICNTYFNSWTLDNIWENVFFLYWCKVLSMQPTSIILYVLGATWVLVQSMVMKLVHTWGFQNAWMLCTVMLHHSCEIGNLLKFDSFQWEH